MTPVAGFYAAKALLTLSAVNLLFSASGTLHMDIFQIPLKVLVNEDVLLGCKVSGFNTAELDLDYVAIKWFLIHESIRRKVYVFNEGNHSSDRPGARINEDDLRKGNASLYLPKIQINEEGQYTCTVFYTPLKAEKSSVVQVLARPKISLSTERVTIPNGSNGSVRCDVTGFYPKQLDIRWEKLSHGKTESVTSKDSGGGLVRNDDGTFNQSSQIYIAATLEDDGINYRCIVKHPSHPNATKLEAQIVVTDSKSTTSVGAIVGVLVVLIGAFFVAGFYCYIKKRQTVPRLTVSELTCSPDAEPGKEVTLLCTISTLFPKDIEVQWYRNKVEIINGGNVGMVMEERFPEDGLPNIIAKANFIPVLDDNQVKYSIKVIYPRASAIPVERSLKLILQVPPPSVSELTCSPDAEAGKEVTLLCTISTVFPKDIEVQWYRDKVEIINGDNFGIVKERGFSESGLPNIIAKAIFSPILDDNQVEYSIKVTHPRVSAISVERSMNLILPVLVLPPTVSEITCSPGPEPGNRVTLSCCVHTYFPKEIKVEWYRGKETIEQIKGDGVIMEEPISDDGLYKTSKLTFTPVSDDDQIEYRIQVIHTRLSSTPIERSFQFNLQALLPLVSEIAFTANPQPNQDATLYSTISMFFSREIVVQWFRGEKIIQNSKKCRISMEEFASEQGLFKTAKLTFTPIPGDDQALYRMKVAYPKIAITPTERKFLLDLKGAPPVVPNIICCSDLTQGEEVTLSCNICAYFPKDIKVEWYRGEAIIESNDKCGVTIEESIEDTYFKFAELTFTASADDDQMEYKIKVTRTSSNTSPTERSFLLQF
uniref:CD276 antigen-like n=1 Tax=Pristiophorus japonicus TaxID=55135 RepID=UPI00398F41B3